MKTISFKFIIAAMVAVATMVVSPSCQKETAGTQDLVKEGETIRVSINAGLGDFVAADATKATATPVVRFEWESTDIVDAYYGTAKLNTDPITVTPSDNKIFAKLSGTIDASGHTFGDDDIITFVYSNGCTVENNLTFNFSNQGATIPFVAYATVKWSEIKSGLTDNILEFKFATSVMKIAATNLDGSDISSATISGINTKVTLAPPTSGETVTITGSAPSTITKNGGIEASSDKTRAIFTVGLVPEDANSNRKLTINGKEAALTSAAIEGSKSYTIPCAYTDEYVVMKMKKSDDGSEYTLKWATKNLGADTVTDYGKLYSWGNLGGQRGNSFDPSFTEDNYKGTTSGKPTEGSKITSATGWVKTKHDAAYNEWGGSWRMPTSQEFKDLYDACIDGDFNTTTNPSGASASVGKGVYWCTSYDGVAGCLFCDGTNKLFFPAAGYGYNAKRDCTNYGNEYGNYWSSSLYTSNTSKAYRMEFGKTGVSPQSNSSRWFGFSVRPVSD